MEIGYLEEGDVFIVVVVGVDEENDVGFLDFFV